jgi:hypothetical protein
VAAWLVVPLFGAIIAAVELTAVLVVVFTALYGGDRDSDRAFRLLRWSLNRPEPPTSNSVPAAEKGSAAGPSRTRLG